MNVCLTKHRYCIEYSTTKELNKQLYLSCNCSKQQGTPSMSWVFTRRGHITLSLVYSYWKFLKFALISATWLNSSVFCLSEFVVRVYYRRENYNTKQTAEKASFSNAWLQIKLSIQGPRWFIRWREDAVSDLCVFHAGTLFRANIWTFKLGFLEFLHLNLWRRQKVQIINTVVQMPLPRDKHIWKWFSICDLDGFNRRGHSCKNAQRQSCVLQPVFCNYLPPVASTEFFVISRFFVLINIISHWSPVEEFS